MNWASYVMIGKLSKWIVIFGDQELLMNKLLQLVAAFAKLIEV